MNPNARPSHSIAFGHRRYGCRDPQGHEWFFAQPIAETVSAGGHDR